MTNHYQTMLERVQEFAKKESRIIGLAIGGSYLTNSLDNYSDLDLIFVVSDDHYDTIMAERISLIETFGHLIAAFTGEHVGEDRLIISLYSDPMLHVDFKFCTLDGLLTRVENPSILYQVEDCLSQVMAQQEAYYPKPTYQWVEDRFWVWVHYGCTKIARGELFEIIDFLSFMRERVLATFIQLNKGALPRGVRKLEFTAPEYVDKLALTVPTYTAASCKAALLATISLYQELREHVSPTHLVKNYQAEEKVLAYVRDVL